MEWTIPRPPSPALRKPINWIRVGGVNIKETSDTLMLELLFMQDSEREQLAHQPTDTADTCVTDESMLPRKQKVNISSEAAGSEGRLRVQGWELIRAE